MVAPTLEPATATAGHRACSGLKQSVKPLFFHILPPAQTTYADLEAMQLSLDDATLRRLENLTIPTHVAVIMDGNRRWARQRGVSGLEGHIAGTEATRRLVEAAADFGVQVLSVFAFSTENWTRTADEVQGLMALIEMALREELEDLQRQEIRVVFSGRRDQLPESLQNLLTEAEAATVANQRMTLNLCINYGGRAEIADAAARIARDVQQGKLEPAQIDTELFATYMYNPQLPDPDLLIRTSGEMRISNFLLYQTAYSEIEVLPTFWPDFDAACLLEAIEQFNQRERRFGGRKS